MKSAPTLISPKNQQHKSLIDPLFFRVRQDIAGGAWCPKSQVDKNAFEYLEIDLRSPHVLTAIETQGRYGNGQGKEYTTHYMLQYRRPGKDWIRYRNRRGAQVRRFASLATSCFLDCPQMLAFIISATSQTSKKCFSCGLSRVWWPDTIRHGNDITLKYGLTNDPFTFWRISKAINRQSTAWIPNFR